MKKLYFRNRYLLIFSILLLPISTFSQKNTEFVLDTLTYNLSEKVFLHIDRNTYSPGDNIWYKAYLLEDLTLHRSKLTSNLHVELISTEGVIIGNNTVFIDNGVGQGNFNLSETIPEGLYFIRAYTNFMRNSGEEIFFKQPIFISKNFNFDLLKDTSTISKNKEIDLQFMPEGGQMIDNVNSRIAFKAIDYNGDAIDINASLYNSKDELIEEFFSLHIGMGYFWLTPNSGENYYVKLTKPASNKKYYLPDALPKGFTVSLNYLEKSNVEIAILSNSDIFHSNKLKLLIQSQEKLILTKQVDVDKPISIVMVSKETLPIGLSTITLLDSSNIPIAERLIYNKNDASFDIRINQIKKQFKHREKVAIEIETKDKQGKPISANLSISVFDTIGWYGNKSNILDIKSYFLLSSDFQGLIENPSYYFNNQDSIKRFQLDLVLLTQGWRRYIWKEVVENTKPSIIYKHENGFTISGFVKTLRESKAVQGGKVNLLGLENGLLYLDTKTDSHGFFKFENIFINDTSRFIIQVFNQKEKKNTIIEIDENKYTYPPVLTLLNSESILVDSKFSIAEYNRVAQERKFYESLRKKNDNILLDPVFIIGKKSNNFRDLTIHGRVEKVLDFDKMEDVPYDSRSALESSGIRIVKSVIPGNNSTLVNYRNRYICPKLLIDEVEHSDFDDIFSYPISSIDRIEILENSLANFFGSPLIISVYTKYGSLYKPKIIVSDEKKLYGIKHIKPRGFQRVREFYSPNYKKENHTFDYKDLRTTIYWSAELNTDSTGRASVSFYTADINTQYYIIIQGISDNDKLGFVKTSLDVKNINIFTMDDCNHK